MSDSHEDRDHEFIVIAWSIINRLLEFTDKKVKTENTLKLKKRGWRENLLKKLHP